MITIEQLKNWSNEKAREEARKKLEEQIEEYIDDTIKKETLKGKRIVRISTGHNDITGHYKTNFYYLWCNKNLSKVNLEVVRNNIINKYKAIGLEVKEHIFYEGWKNSYEGLEIFIPEHLLEDE